MKSVVLFVHGIRSHCATAFATLDPAVRKDARFAGWEIEHFNYPWQRGVQFGAGRLRKRLASLLGSAKSVYVVAHSMGGLVMRKALVDDPNLIVKRVIMVATPNFGAISSAQLSSYIQPVVEGVWALRPIRARWQAYYDLMHVYDLFKEAKTVSVPIEYATTAAAFFHEHRLLFGSDAFQSPNKMFTGLSIVADLILTFPIRGDVQRPHDGIVAVKNVNFIPPGAGRETEKWKALKATSNPANRTTYAHVRQRLAEEEVNHNSILHDARYVELIKDLIACTSLAQFERARTDDPALEILTP